MLPVRTGWWAASGTFRLTDKQPTTRGTKYAWACTVTQAHGMQVEKATNTTKPLEDTEAQEIKALYAEYDEGGEALGRHLASAV